MARTARWSDRFGPACRSYSQDGLWRAMSWSSDGSAAGDRSEIRPIAHARAFPLLSERSTPGDPSEIRRNAPPRAPSQTSERSRPGGAHVCMIMSTPSVFGPRDPSRRPDHEMVRLARRPRPAPELVAAGGMPRRDATPLASTSHVRGWLGWVHYRLRGCVGGRPRRGGTPVHDETVTAGCPRNCPVVLIVHSRPTTG
jgi:hypothetical protein